MKKQTLLLSIVLILFAFTSCEVDTKQPPEEMPGKKITHTVTFLVDGNEYVEEIVESGDTVAPPLDPESESSRFTGWLLGNKPFDFSTPIDCDITLDACWDLVFVTFEIAEALTQAGSVALLEKSIVVHPGVKLDPSGILTIGGNSADVLLLFDEDEVILTLENHTITENTTLTITDIKTEDTFYISTFKGLQEWVKSSSGWDGGNCVLLSDIYMPEPEEGGSNWTTPDGTFHATFDGKGHTISGLTINSSSGDCGFLSSNKGIIQNINFKDVAITSNESCGVITGENNGTIQSCTVYIVTISNTYTDATIYEGIGGIAGYNIGTITDCHTIVEGNISTSGGLPAGGIAGSNGTGGTISDCYSIIQDEGKIHSENERSGGIAGYSNGVIIGSHSIVNGNISNLFQAGGIAGGSYGEIKGCYSIINGSISGSEYVGGITGQYGSDTKVTACYSIINGSFDGDTVNVGGVCGGSLSSGNISACYWTGNAEKGVGTGDDSGKTIKVEENGWTDAMNAMNTALAGSGYKYELNAFADKDTIPLVLVHAE